MADKKNSKKEEYLIALLGRKLRGSKSDEEIKKHNLHGIFKEKGKESDPKKIADLTPFAFVGGNKTVLPFPKGLNLIVAGAGKGKTTLIMDMLASASRDKSIMEGFLMYDESSTRAFSSPVNIINDLFDQKEKGSSIIFIDSLSLNEAFIPKPVWDRGGFNRTMRLWYDLLNKVAIALDLTVVAGVDLGRESTSENQLMTFEYFRGRVSSIVVLSDIQVVGGEFKFDIAHTDVAFNVYNDLIEGCVRTRIPEFDKEFDLNAFQGEVELNHIDGSLRSVATSRDLVRTDRKNKPLDRTNVSCEPTIGNTSFFETTPALIDGLEIEK